MEVEIEVGYLGSRKESWGRKLEPEGQNAQHNKTTAIIFHGSRQPSVTLHRISSSEDNWLHLHPIFKACSSVLAHPFSVTSIIISHVT